jgi:hypothetical protein
MLQGSGAIPVGWSSYYLVGKRTQALEPTTPGFAEKPTAGLLQLKCKQRTVGDTGIKIPGQRSLSRLV